MVRGPFMSRAASLRQQSVKTALGLACGDTAGMEILHIISLLNHEIDMNVIYYLIIVANWRRLEFENVL